MKSKMYVASSPSVRSGQIMEGLVVLKIYHSDLMVVGTFGDTVFAPSALYPGPKRSLRNHDHRLICTMLRFTISRQHITPLRAFALCRPMISLIAVMTTEICSFPYKHIRPNNMARDFTDLPSEMRVCRIIQS